jgi:soluble lytic murein transglycosylase-like protein
MARPYLTAVAVTLALTASAGQARAEIVFLTSGRTLSVKGHEIKGDSIVLTLRSGAEVTCDRSLVERISADEVPYPEPVRPATAVADPQSPEASGLLQTTPYGEIISSMAEAHGVDPLLVRALIQVESNYKPRARSPKGAMGLMQIMPATARVYNVRNPFDPKANIEAGIKHLKSLIDRFGGGVELALAAYNAGEGAVSKFNGVPPYRETKSYVSRILALAGIQ